jgi:ATP-dependent exoDNAse (exonuclease V) alpha subunit
VVVLAPTGIAALNVKGQTIHSFFRFPPKLINPGDIRRIRGARMFQKLDAIIIDEVSMVRADMIDNIDIFLRINRGKDEPFGGAQMLFFGDLFQLPPVVATDFERQYLSQKYDSPYFFSAEIFKDSDLDFEMVELQTVFRQDDQRFIRLLDAIRTNDLDWDDLEELNSRCNKHETETEELNILLSGRNSKVDKINQEKLNGLPSREYEFLAKIEGDFNQKFVPTSPVLKLKTGAQVMFLKNDPEKKFVNGTLGTVSFLDHDKIKVNIPDGKGGFEVIDVDQMEWEYIKYGLDDKNPGEVRATTLGTFKQYPLKLAWAITIHKSQGKTFNHVILDMGARGAFEFGQTYVALSRCTSLEGLVLKSPLKPSDIMVDQRIIDFLDDKRR